jgi:hypothetical protein
MNPIDSGSSGHPAPQRRGSKSKEQVVADQALKEAIEKGQLDKLKTLLPEGKCLSQEDSGWAIRLATSSGQLDVIEFLKTRQSSISPEDLGRAIRSAIRDDDLDAVRMLVDKEGIIDGEIFVDCIKSAINRGRNEILRYLLDKQVIPQKDLGFILNQMVEEANTELIECFLEKAKGLTHAHFFSALERAIAMQSNIKVFFLLAYGPTLSAENLYRAINQALHLNRLSIVQLLLEEEADFPQDFLHLLAQNAVDHHNLELLQILLAEGRSLSAENTVNLASIALTNNHLDTLQVLINRGPEEPFIGHNFLFLLAIEVSSPSIVEFLLNDGYHISPEILGQAAESALDFNRPDITMIILDTGQEISLHSREAVVQYASSHGLLDMLEAALQNGPIRSEAIFSARRNAESASTPELRQDIEDWLDQAVVLPSEDDEEMPEENVIICSFAEVAANPLIYLQRCSKQFPDRISLIDAPAIDLGGVTKQFISVLSEALQPMVGDVVSAAGNEMKLEVFTQLGQLFSAIVERNEYRRDKLITGPLFPTFFFADLKVLNESQQIPPFPFPYGMGERGVCERLLQEDPVAYQALHNYVFNPIEANQEVFAQSLGESFEEAVEQARATLNQYLEPAQAFLEGASEALKEQIQSTELNELVLRLQGEAISAQKLIKSLKLENANAILQQQFEWVCEAIREDTENFKELFVRAICGNRCLKEGMLIHIKPAPGEQVIIRTCLNTLELPNQLALPQSFDQSSDEQKAAILADLKAVFLAVLTESLKENDFNAP